MKTKALVLYLIGLGVFSTAIGYLSHPGFGTASFGLGLITLGVLLITWAIIGFVWTLTLVTKRQLCGGDPG